MLNRISDVYRCESLQSYRPNWSQRKPLICTGIREAYMVTAVCEEESRKDNAGRLPATFYTNGLHGNARYGTPAKATCDNASTFTGGYWTTLHKSRGDKCRVHTPISRPKSRLDRKITPRSQGRAASEVVRCRGRLGLVLTPATRTTGQSNDIPTKI